MEKTMKHWLKNYGTYPVQQLEGENYGSNKMDIMMEQTQHNRKMETIMDPVEWTL